MSTSDSRSSYHPFRVAVGYLAVAAFTALFGLIYEHYSHEVESVFMQLAFLIPLFAGPLPACLLRLLGTRFYPGTGSRSVYRWSVSVFTLGSLLKGVFDIYGTASIFPYWYAIAGCVFAIVSVAIYMIERLLYSRAD